MHSLAFSTISQAAQNAGLPESSIFAGVAQDNITLPRPRCEISFLPEEYSRTGKKLAIQRAVPEQAQQKLIRELYTVNLDAQARLFATDAHWIEGFGFAFVAALANGERGTHAPDGSWVEVRVRSASLEAPRGQRIGDKQIQVLPRLEKLYVIRFTWRITHAEYQGMLTDIRIQPPVVQSS